MLIPSSQSHAFWMSQFETYDSLNLLHSFYFMVCIFHATQEFFKNSGAREEASFLKKE